MRTGKISWNTKIKTFKRGIRPAVLYSAETVSMTNKDREKLTIFERNILSEVFSDTKRLAMTKRDL